MKIGLQIPDFTWAGNPEQLGQTLATIARTADDAGFEHIMVMDHFFQIHAVGPAEHEMLEAYGAWGEKSMYGRTFEGIFRTTVLIGTDGRIVKIWRSVKVDGHADEVLAAVRTA